MIVCNHLSNCVILEIIPCTGNEAHYLADPKMPTGMLEACFMKVVFAYFGCFEKNSLIGGDQGGV